MNLKLVDACYSSIIDSSCIAVKTEGWNLDTYREISKLIILQLTDSQQILHRLAHYGEERVLVLTSDSTNSHAPGFTRTEKTVGPTFERIFQNAKRVLMSTFSSNIHRVAQAIEKALNYGRKNLCYWKINGKNLEIAMNLGYIKFPKDQFIEAHEVNKYNDNEIFCYNWFSRWIYVSSI